MSSQPSVSTTNQSGTKTPTPGPQSDLFNNIWGTTNNVVSNAVNQPVPQNTVAPATPAQQSGAQQMINLAPTLGGGAAGTNDLLSKITSGYFSNPQNDPNFQGAVKSVLDPLTTNLTTSILPQVKDASLRASGAGTGPAAYGGIGGGSPQDKLTENVLNNWNTTTANTIAGMAENSRNAGLNLIPQVPSLAASGTAQALTPSATTETGGALEQGFAQGGLQNTLNSYLLNGQGPLGFLTSGAGIGSTGGFGDTTGTSTTTGTPPSLMTQWLQGLTGGASSLGSLFGSGPGGSASAASNIASGLGSAGSWLSNLLTPALGSTGASIAGLLGPAAVLA